MSAQQRTKSPEEVLESQLRPRRYKPGTGSDRYIRFVEDWLGMQVAETQRRMLEALEQHRRVVISTANGVGKSYGGGAAGGLAALYCNPNTTVNITSGSYGQLDDTIWKPIKSLHRRSELPGRTLDNTREVRTEFDEEWYLRCLSPTYPADLEGRHNERMIYIIEEADKPGITHEHIDSAESTLTDEGDRMLVIANPPEDEGNVVYDLIDSDKWHTVEIASWESRNVLVEAGEHDGPKIPGLVDLSEIRRNWEDWNGEEWPGLDTARTAHLERDDLDKRWYRRRAGIMPPEGAGAFRPFSVADVRDAFERSPTRTRQTPSALGIDVARKHDNTVMIGRHEDELVIHYDEQGDNHEVQGPALANIIDGWPSPDIAVDFVGGGQGIHDQLDARFPNVREFNNGGKASADTTYKDCWAEALAVFGEFIRDGGTFAHNKLREEALVAARTVEFNTKHLASRGVSGAEVITATPKDEIKEQLGRSPDYLDAAAMCIWSSEAAQANTIDKLTW